jgi:hypothetical protein
VAQWRAEGYLAMDGIWPADAIAAAGAAVRLRL